MRISMVILSFVFQFFLLSGVSAGDDVAPALPCVLTSGTTGVSVLDNMAPAFPCVLTSGTTALTGSVPAFPLHANDLELKRLAQPNTYFDRVGRRCAILGVESGSFEAWCYPLKLFRNFEFSFFIQSSTEPIRARDIVRYISVTPEAAVLTYTYQSFTVRAIYVTPINEAGAVILLDVETTEPLTIVCSFIPVLQPMWPAGIGGQYSFWDDDLTAYIITESSKRNQGIVGSPAAMGMSYTPAHMLSDAPNQFRIEIEDMGQVWGTYIPIVIAGGKGEREVTTDTYHRLAADPERYYRENVDHYRTLRESTMQVQTPDRDLNVAFEWAKVSFDNLIVSNPDLGTGMVAGLGTSGTGGRPGFGWFFGGDTFINSFSLLSYGAFTAVRDALQFNIKWQREDGKMAHELSQAAAYIDWFNDYPFAYIHGDTSPYFIAACYDYLRWTGDAVFLKQCWPAIKKAYDWCLSTDRDGDGLMDNREAGLGALEYGSLTDIQTDVYLAAVWARAAYAMHAIAGTVGDDAYAQRAREDFEQAGEAFDEKFWDGDPWSAVGLMWELGRPERSAHSLRNMSTSALSTDWGVRSLSIESDLFEPLNYNYGAVWPFLTSFVSTAMYRHQFTLQGFSLLTSTVQHTFNSALGHVNEAFSGYQHIWPMESVPHQGFCTAGIVLPFVRGMLGLEGDACAGILYFKPGFPAHWDTVSVKNCRVGKESLDFIYRRGKTSARWEVTRRTGDPFTMVFGPVFSAGTKVINVTVNGESVPYEVAPSSRAVQPVVEFDLGVSNVLEVSFEPTVELVPPRFYAQVGESNRGIKIVDMIFRKRKLSVTVEGLAGRYYSLRVVNGERVESVSGARYEDGMLHVHIPDRGRRAFTSHEIVIAVK